MIAKKSLLVLFVGLFVAAGIAWVAQPAYAGGPDHLKCYKVKEPEGDKLDHTGELEAPKLGNLTENCRIVGKIKFLCVPVNKGTLEPPAPRSSPGSVELSLLYTCYKIKCEGDDPDLQNETILDQFGSHNNIRVKRTAMICAPADFS
jgi:hypothetical protein